MQDSSKKRIAIFASGEGSNAEIIMQYFAEINTIDVVLMLCNRKNAGVFERAKKLAVKTEYLPKNEFYESNKALDVLSANSIDFIILSGFLLKIPDEMVFHYDNRIINIHPSLLPKHGGFGMYGLHVHRAVKQAGEIETGITIHLVNEAFDDGKILFQAKCGLDNNDSVEDIQNKVQKLEHKFFAKTVHQYIEKYAD